MKSTRWEYPVVGEGRRGMSREQEKAGVEYQQVEAEEAGAGAEVEEVFKVN